MISVIMCAYNRAHSIPRAIKSLLAQDYREWELIIVDDGSSDNTENVVKEFQDPRIHFLKHDMNMGVSAAKNTGLDHIRGDWFTFLDSDDEMVVPGALSRLVRVPKEVDQRIDAVTCNCLDSVTGKFTGNGLAKDGYLSYQTILEFCSGEFWGLTKTSLLDGDRFNPQLRGYEDVLWHKIDKRACRYYIHEGLRVYHTEGSDRLCLPGAIDPRARESLYVSYKGLLAEKEYLDDYRRFKNDTFRGFLYGACLSFIEYGDRRRAIRPFLTLMTCRRGFVSALIVGICLIFGSHFLTSLRNFKFRIMAGLHWRGES
jgi:glycosyltransferase involved in cell wall biosynthesis